MSKIICFHHDDLDGIASAAIVRRKLGKEVEMREMRYGMDPTKDVPEGSRVLFVDFSPRGMDDVKVLIEDLDCTVEVYDHHETAFNRLMGKTISEKMGQNLTLKFDLKKAGCQIVWEEFYPEEKMPSIIHLLGEYDRWDHSDPQTLPTHYGMSFMEQDPCLDEMWNEIFEPTPLEENEDGMKMGLTLHEIVMNMGETALMYKAQQEKRTVRAAHLIDFHGTPTICVNAQLTDSYAFASALENEKFKDAKALLWYYRTEKGLWKYSLRSHPAHADVNVAKLAQKYPGGGGHPGAAGFAAEELLPEITA